MRPAAHMPANAAPPPRRMGRFPLAIIILTTLYGLWAAVLSYRVVVKQQAVRHHLELALRTQPRHPFASARQARRYAREWLRRLEARYPQNPCGAGPAYRLASGRRRLPACTVVLIPQGHHIAIQAYDTQGQAMDTVFEGLNPPPRHL